MTSAINLKEQVELTVQEDAGVEVCALQPISVVDHVVTVDADTLRSLVPDELGGSHRVPLEDIQRVLATVGEYFSKAGGSASNVMRGLAGFGVSAALIGARGGDEWGALFNSSLKRAGVGLDGVLVKPGVTGRCCILSCQGQRTMRTCLDGAARLAPEELSVANFAGAKYVFLSGYCLYTPGLLERAVDLALASSCRIALDLASFEVVRDFREQLTGVVHSGAVSVCFCNEDEAVAWAGGYSDEDVGHGGVRTPEDGLALLARHCDITVVTLGEKGCLVRQKEGGNGEGDVIAQPAVSGVLVVDTTGAGDLFASGFLYSLLRGYSLRRAAEIGCLAGGAVVQTLGAEMSHDTWHWLHARLHGELAAETVRSSAAAVQQELLACYALIEQKGRGVVFYGSARLRQGSGHWERGRALATDVARLLGCTTWSGGGPGMMEAATLGAMDAGCPVAGIRIGREAGTTVRSASYLPADSQVVCRFMSSRKVALTDAGVRMKESDRTAFIFLPGGLGTMDELFELMCLMQLRKLGTRFPVPLVLCNFPHDPAEETESGSSTRASQGFYDGLLEFLASCVALETVGTPELRDVVVAWDERQVLAALAEFYGMEGAEDGLVAASPVGKGLVRAAEWVEQRLAAQRSAAAP